jgi:16S rRNA (adenine1518-N6/adenine1519-N6)-dimethyltransferase
MVHSPLATPSSTRTVLEQHGLFARRSLGQHFLVDDNVVGRILDLAELDAGDVVVEVGPGIGTLTLALCATGARVVAVEADERLLPVLEETTASCPELAVVHADAVRIAPHELAGHFGAPAKLVANLPYGVAATVVLGMLTEVPSIERAVVMVQAEVADRMAATPGGKDYGAYTVKLRQRAEPMGRFAVSRNCFMPPPNVDSAVIRLDRVAAAAARELAAGLDATADAAFSQRRKTLRNSLAAGLDISRDDVEEALTASGLDGSRRAEMLTQDEFVRLAGDLGARGHLT